MRRKKKSDIHIVENHEDETDALIDEVLKELREEDGVQEEIDEQVRKHRKKSKDKEDYRGGSDRRRSCSNGIGG